MKTLGEKLRYARECKGVTQEKVYLDTGIHNKTLSGYERNVSQPDVLTLGKLARYYNFDVNYFLDEKSKLDRHKGLLLEELKRQGYDLSDKSTEDLAKIIIKALKIDEINKSN